MKDQLGFQASDCMEDVQEPSWQETELQTSGTDHQQWGKRDKFQPY